MHPHFQTVTVKEVRANELVFELADGTMVQWPREAGYLPELHAGDSLTLTLTRTENLINDLLHSDHANE